MTRRPFHQFARVGTAAAIAPFPAADFGWPALNSKVALRLAVFFAAVAIAAVIVYIGAVNAMLVGGENALALARELKSLEKRYAKLQDTAVKQESPQWLEQISRSGGMVETRDIRFITQDQSVALSR